MFKILRNKKGQSATEYMLIIAIVVLGLVAAASALLPKFKSGVNTLGDNVIKTLERTYENQQPGG